MAADGCGTLIGLAVPSKALLVSFFRRRRRQWWLERGEGLSAVTGSGEGQSVGVVLSVTCSLLIFFYSLFLIRK